MGSPIGRPMGRPMGRPWDVPWDVPWDFQMEFPWGPMGIRAGRSMAKPMRIPIGRSMGRPVVIPMGRPMGSPQGRPIWHDSTRPDLSVNEASRPTPHHRVLLSSNRGQHPSGGQHQEDPLPPASGKIRWTPLPPLASQAQATKQLALPYYLLLEVPIQISKAAAPKEAFDFKCQQARAGRAPFSKTYVPPHQRCGDSD